MKNKVIKIFLRLAIASSFLSAVADRFGIWAEDVSVWGNWTSFLEYTQVLNPWFPVSVTNILGTTATVAEILLAVCLIIGFKTELFAKLSGVLILLFAVSMISSVGIKAAFDFSVLSASAAAFALSTMKEKYLEIDSLIFKPKIKS